MIVKPPPPVPRRDPKKRSRLVAEHRRRNGDPALGGSTRAPIMTAYRQQALACASALSPGPRRVRDLRAGDSRRGEDPAAQRLWLVRSRRARGLRADRCRTRRLKRWPQPRVDFAVEPAYFIDEPAKNHDLNDRAFSTCAKCLECLNTLWKIVACIAGLPYQFHIAMQHEGT